MCHVVTLFIDRIHFELIINLFIQKIACKLFGHTNQKFNLNLLRGFDNLFYIYGTSIQYHVMVNDPKCKPIFSCR